MFLFYIKGTHYTMKTFFFQRLFLDFFFNLKFIHIWIGKAIIWYHTSIFGNLIATRLNKIYIVVVGNAKYFIILWNMELELAINWEKKIRTLSQLLAQQRKKVFSYKFSIKLILVCAIWILFFLIGYWSIDYGPNYIDI